MALHSGWEVFSIDPGTKGVMYCLVCGEECVARRNVMGPTCWVESMMGGKHLHDTFTCKHAEEKWHQQLRSLKQEQERTHSQSIKQIIQKDIDTVLAGRPLNVEGESRG